VALDRPDPTAASQRVRFGTSGHQDFSLKLSFNEVQIATLAQALGASQPRRGLNIPKENVSNNRCLPSAHPKGPGRLRPPANNPLRPGLGG
jgi:hypothetical protein